MSSPRSVVARIAVGLSLLILLASRSILPDGPWEQDEAILATGVIDYDVVHHRPHPPGFPAWVAAGKVVAGATGDPLLALRMLSGALSMITVVLLAMLLRPLVGTPIACASALVYGFLPGIWSHASRAFTSTPAVAMAVLATWLWTRKERWALYASWMALAVAGLIRPQMGLVLGVLAVAGVVERRHPMRDVAKAVALAALIVAAALAMMVIDTGWPALRAAFGSHWSNHAARSGARPWPAFADLGLVRTLGGAVGATAWFVAAVAGLILHVRQRPKLILWVAMLVAAGLVTVWALHNPLHPRYAIPAVAAAVPAVAMAAQRLGPRLGLVALVGAGALALSAGAPAVWAMHRTPLPPVAALRAWNAAGARGQALVYPHGLVSFVRYEAFMGRLPGPVVDQATALERPPEQLTAPFAVLLGGRSRGLPGATVRRRTFSDFPAAAWDLSQRRFMSTTLVFQPVSIGRGAFPIEFNVRDEAFAWLGPQVHLLAPTGADSLHLVLWVDGRRSPAPISAEVAGRKALVQTLQVGATAVEIPLSHCRPDSPCPVTLEFSKAVRPPNDPRLLSARLYGAWAQGPGLPIAAARFGPGQPLAAMAHGVELSGFFPSERFGPHHRPGAWTRGDASLRFPAVAGTVSITLAQPPPRDPTVRLATNAEQQTVRVKGRPRTFTMRVAAADGFAEVRVRGATHRPADHGSRDRRDLGPIVFEVDYRPDR